jgi:hypothetical protein
MLQDGPAAWEPALPLPTAQAEISFSTSGEPHFGQLVSPAPTPIFCSSENVSLHPLQRYS